MEKPRAGVQVQTVEKLLIKLRQSVNVVVSLVNMCRTHHKVKKQNLGGFFVNICFVFHGHLLKHRSHRVKKYSHFKMMVQVTVHAMAVKYGGKFVDSFLKGIGVTLLITMI